MTRETVQQVRDAAGFICNRMADAGKAPPRIALVLGSGLGHFANSVEDPCIVPYSEIPNFPQSTVSGHAGRLIVGTLREVSLVVMQGRVHAYEGYTAEQVAFPIRVLGAFGIKQIILTNASGSLRPDLGPSSLVAVSDHINFTGANPCVGPNDPSLGPRFFDMTSAYSPRLRTLAMRTAEEQGWHMSEAVYLGLLGPNFETPAEIRFFRTIGADLVGMSTVLEVLAARHIGMEILAISCVTNLAAGLREAELSHAEVLETGQHVGRKFADWLSALLPIMAALPDCAVS